MCSSDAQTRVPPPDVDVSRLGRGTRLRARCAIRSQTSNRRSSRLFLRNRCAASEENAGDEGVPAPGAANSGFNVGRSFRLNAAGRRVYRRGTGVPPLSQGSAHPAAAGDGERKVDFGLGGRYSVDMQSICALEIRGSQESPVRSEVTVDGLKRLASEAACGEPVALLLVDEELGALTQQSGGLIVWRGRKNPAKQLAHYFAKRAGIVAVTAAYTVSGQALRGVRALLLSFGASRCHALCLIGVPRDTFNALHERAACAAWTADPADGGGDSIQRLEAMLNAGERIPVPDELCRAFIGTSPAAKVLRRLILCAARTDIPVLIEGESGTGKEIIATRIHEGSVRKSGHFYPVNCGSIPAELFESTLFGHEKGSFTGADCKKEGAWTIADRGTLFLDEIGDLTLFHQAKVLRVLDGNGYLPVGATKEVKSGARVVAATNRDLAAMVRQGTFRDDLYYRLFSFRIRTYPLRQHPEDIPLLAQYFWGKVGQAGQTPGLSEAVLNELKLWRWPGNARELKSFLANTYAFAGGQPVTVELVRNVFRDRLGPQVAVLGQDR